MLLKVEQTLQNVIVFFPAAGYLLVSLVPSTPFRQGFRASHRANREPHLSTEAQTVLHQVYTALLRFGFTSTGFQTVNNKYFRLLPAAKHYTDMQQHGSMKLTTYFALLMYCCISRTEKLMVLQMLLVLAITIFLNGLNCSLASIFCNCGIYSTRNYPNLRYRLIITNKHCWHFGITCVPIVPKMYS